MLNKRFQINLLWALPLIYLVVSSCATSGKYRQPTLAEGHIGQTLVASSETSTKHSLIDTALSQLRQIENLNRALRLEAAKQNALTTRQLFIEMAGLIDSQRPCSENNAAVWHTSSSVACIILTWRPGRLMRRLMCSRLVRLSQNRALNCN